MELVIPLALFVFGGLATYTLCERRHRRRWFLFERRPVEDPAGPFRRDAGPASTRAVLVQRRAPATIRRTALWSIYMGQMALPGGLLGLVGLFAMGIGLISIPGMILAIWIWRLGYALLRRDPKAEREARALQRFAVILNLVTVGVALLLVLFGGWEFESLALVLLDYAAVSFAHAAALGRCATLLAKHRELEDRSEEHTSE